jgi:hypothetical protein
MATAPTEWHGGHPAGGLSKQKTHWLLQFKNTPEGRKTRSFSFKDYGGVEQAKAAALKEKIAMSLFYGLTKNLWKIGPHPNKGCEHLQCYHMQTASGNIIYFSLRALEILRAIHWTVSTAKYRDKIYKYAQGLVNGVMTSMHRLLLPGVMEVDHLDHNGLNNTDENLRPCVSHSDNMQNTVLRRNNTTGLVGVRKEGEYYFGTLTVRKHSVVKRFSIAELGEDGARQMAHDWRIVEKRRRYSTNFDADLDERADSLMDFNFPSVRKSKSGIKGVTSLSHGYSAWCTALGNQARRDKYFSFTKFGKEGALEQARLQRLQYEADMKEYYAQHPRQSRKRKRDQSLDQEEQESSKEKKQRIE